QRDEVDLAAVDAAGLVDHLPEYLVGLSDHAIGRGRAAVGTEMTDLDLLVGRSVIVLLLRERRTRCCEQGGGRDTAHETTPAGNQRFPPWFELMSKVHSKMPTAK